MILDMDRWEIRDGDCRVLLTRTEATVVQAVAHSGVAKYDTIISDVWGWDEPLSARRTINVHVCNVRRKLRVAGLPELIKTVWAVGLTISTPIVVETSESAPIMVPARFRAVLEKLLYTHPDHATANRVLSLIVGQ